MEKIAIACPNCQTNGEVDVAFVGKQIRCNRCSTLFMVTAPTPQTFSAAATQVALPPQPAPPATVAPQTQPPLSSVSTPPNQPQYANDYTVLVDERTFRTTVHNVTSTALAIVALVVARYIVEMLPGIGARWGRLSVGEYLILGISIAALVMLIKVFSPVKTVVLFYVSTYLKAKGSTGREADHARIITISNYVVYLVYLIALYQFFAPVLGILNYTFLNVNRLNNLLDIVCVLAGIYLLYKLWTTITPMMKSMADKITDSLVTSSNKLAYKACPNCQTQNPIDGAFCVSCGTSLTATPAPVVSSVPAAQHACKHCGANLRVEAQFCDKCGGKC